MKHSDAISQKKQSWGLDCRGYERFLSPKSRAVSQSCLLIKYQCDWGHITLWLSALSAFCIFHVPSWFAVLCCCFAPRGSTRRLFRTICFVILLGSPDRGLDLVLSHPMQMTKETFTKQRTWLSSCSVAFNYTSKELRNSNVLFRCEVLFAHGFCSNFSK